MPWLPNCVCVMLLISRKPQPGETGVLGVCGGMGRLRWWEVGISDRWSWGSGWRSAHERLEDECVTVAFEFCPVAMGSLWSVLKRTAQNRDWYIVSPKAKRLINWAWWEMTWAWIKVVAMEIKRGKRFQGNIQEATSMEFDDIGYTDEGRRKTREKTPRFLVGCFPTKIHNRGGKAILGERKMRLWVHFWICFTLLHVVLGQVQWGSS